jgi:hypothetical protein
VSPSGEVSGSIDIIATTPRASIDESAARATAILIHPKMVRNTYLFSCFVDPIQKKLTRSLFARRAREYRVPRGWKIGF